MIRHAEHARTTLVADARGCMAAFGGLFVLSGLTAIVLGVSSAQESPWTRLVVVGIGLAHLAGGLLVAAGESRSASVDARGATVTHRRRGRVAETRHVPARAVETVAVEEGCDSDGDATFRVGLRLATREFVPLTTNTTPSREAAQAVAEAVARRLEAPERVEW